MKLYKEYRMKKWKKIGALSIISLGICLSGVALWQWENIKVIYEGVTYSTDTLQAQRVASNRAVVKALEKYALDKIPELTQEEQNLLETGELTVEEATQETLTNRRPSFQEANQERGIQQDPIKPDMSVSKRESEIVAHYTAKMYALRSKYKGELGKIESQGWSLLNSYSNGQASFQALVPQGFSLVQRATRLETSCDQEVKQVLSSLKQALEVLKVDTHIVQTMEEAYDTEKRVQKAYYFSLIPKG